MQLDYVVVEDVVSPGILATINASDPNSRAFELLDQLSKNGHSGKDFLPVVNGVLNHSSTLK